MPRIIDVFWGQQYVWTELSEPLASDEAQNSVKRLVGHPLLGVPIFEAGDMVPRSRWERIVVDQVQRR